VLRALSAVFAVRRRDAVAVDRPGRVLPHRLGALGDAVQECGEVLAVDVGRGRTGPRHLITGVPLPGDRCDGRGRMAGPGVPVLPDACDDSVAAGAAPPRVRGVHFGGWGTSVSDRASVRSMTELPRITPCYLRYP
jgi:hypothetical protein